MDKADKPAPDIFRLLKVRPTRIPKTVRETPAGAPAPPGVNWQLLFILAGGVLVIVFVVFAYSLFGKQVFNDAFSLHRLAQLSDSEAFWSQLRNKMFTVPLSQQWLQATYVWDYLSDGNHLIWYHAVNVILHALSCLYLYLLIFRISWRLALDERIKVNPYYVAFAAAAIFACHPLTVESVAYISGRAGVLAAANYFLSLNFFLLAYLGAGSGLRIFGSLMAFCFMAIGLTVSGQALTLPACMIALAALLKKESQPWLEWWSNNAITLSVLALTQAALPFLIFRGYEIQSACGTGAGAASPLVYYATQLKAIPFYYLRCALLPAGLSIDPPFYLATGFADIGTILGALVLLAAIAGLYLMRKQPLVCLGLFLFIAGFIPDGLIMQPELLSDRRFYLSLAGLCLIAGWLLARLALKSFRQAAIACGALIIVLSGLTVWRETAWQSTMALARATLKSNSRSAQGHALLAIELLRDDKGDEAMKEAQEAVKAGPNFCPALIAQGNLLLAKDDYKAADELFEKAKKLAEDEHLSPEVVASIQVGLAESLFGLRQAPYAAFAAQQAVEVYPESFRMHLILGKCLVAAGNYPKALLELQEARRFNQSLEEAWEPITKAALHMGYKEVALPAAQRWVAFTQSPESQVAYVKAGILAQNYPACHKALDYMLAKSPDNAQGLGLYALVYEAEGLKEKADEYRKRALKADPGIFTKLSSLPSDGI